MNRETAWENEHANAQFRDLVFLHSVAGNAPKLYDILFGENAQGVNEAQIEWEIPQNRAEFESMMDELREIEGLNLNL